MHKNDIVDAIHQVLQQPLNIPRISAFSEDARLNEDLYLDSVLVMQLLLNLEIQLDIEIPDTALSKDDFDTVSNLADFLLRHKHGILVDEEEKEPEEFEDIKVHCFVSCLCEMIKADPRTDHRPFYFGVWDAEVVVDENASISYHSDTINHDFFRHWFEALYSAPITPWYNAGASKADNITHLLSLLDVKTPTQNIMVMLDMFRLPERENKFNRDPFPHYVMLENTDDPNTFMMYDPDFRWEGLQPRDQVLHAIDSDAVAGGYRFDSNDIKPTEPQAVHDYFLAAFNPAHNPMTDGVKAIIETHLDANTKFSPSQLGVALEQLPVLAIRKYAYEHGLAYFWIALDLPDDEFEHWCDVVEALVSTFKQIQFKAMKIARHFEDHNEIDTHLKEEIDELIREQNVREFEIKHRLRTVFELWALQQGLMTHDAAKEAIS